MAIYHLSAQVISRSTGRSSTAAAAYRAGERIVDERSGEVHDYTRKGGVLHDEILAPAGAPAWATDRARLWNAVESAEKRKDAQLCREVDIALPSELGESQRLDLVREFVQRQFVDAGMIADVCLHAPGREGDDRNFHAHVQLTMRSIGPDGFGPKVRDWNTKALLQSWREAWEQHANAALERAGIAERIDHRTLDAQGIERVPQIHIGPKVAEMEARGIRTDRGDLAMAIDDANEELEELTHARRIVESAIREDRGGSRRALGDGGGATSPEHGEAVRRPEDTGLVHARGQLGAGGRLVEGAGPSLGLGLGIGGGDVSHGRAVGEDVARSDAGSRQSLESGQGGDGGSVVAPGQALAAGGDRGRRDGGAYERVLDLSAPLAAAGGDAGRPRGSAVPDDQRRTDMQDRTAAAVDRQLQAMGCSMYEVGVRHPTKGMLLREWAADMIRKSIAWLKRQNAQGCDIYIRPARSAASSLVLVDDLNSDAVRALPGMGLAPAVVTETSKGNYQAWVRLSPEAQPPAVRTQAARALASELGGDMNSADFGHFGRLAGFTNRKPERAVAGRQPYVLVEHAAPGAVADRGHQIVIDALKTLSAERQREVHATVKESAQTMPAPARAWGQRERDVGKWYQGLWKSLQDRFADDFDPSRADWLAATALIGRGFDVDSVASSIAKYSPGAAGRKGKDLDDYVLNTAGKAEIWVELQAKGAAYADVAEQLLPMAKQRAADRAAEQELQAANERNTPKPPGLG